MAKILIVDDNRTILELYRVILTKVGHEVTAVPNGEKALEALSKDVFQLLLLDINLPGIGGGQLARMVRETPAGKDVRVIAMSGMADTEAIDAIARETFDLVLLKPIHPSDLRNAVIRLCGGGQEKGE